jgi:bacterioferritin (cytochrome b1)
MSKDVEILNKGLAAEQFATMAYTLAAETGLLTNGVLNVAKTFMSHHADHAKRLYDTIISLGGEPVKPLSKDEYAKQLPLGLSEEKSIIHYALTLEKGATITYLNAIPEFENPKLAQAAASILGDEAMHWAVLRGALGMPPVHISFIPLSADEVED